MSIPHEPQSSPSRHRAHIATMFRSIIFLCVVSAACAAPIATSINNSYQNQIIETEAASEQKKAELNDSDIRSKSFEFSENVDYKSSASIESKFEIVPNVNQEMKNRDQAKRKRVRRFAVGDGRHCPQGYIRVQGICTPRNHPIYYQVG